MNYKKVLLNIGIVAIVSFDALVTIIGIYKFDIPEANQFVITGIEYFGIIGFFIIRETILLMILFFYEVKFIWYYLILVIYLLTGWYHILNSPIFGN